MFWKKNRKSIEKEQDKDWTNEKILKFMLENFGSQIEEDLFDDFEDYVKFKKNKIDTSEKIEFLLNNFRDDIEEDMFKDFDEYVEFRRATEDLGDEKMLESKYEDNSKIIIKNVVKRKPGYLYYVDDKGNVCEAKMAKGGKID